MFDTESREPQTLVEKSKWKAARAAVDKFVTKDVAVLGVGSGSTVVYAVERLFELKTRGLLNPDLVCIPTSFQSKQLIVQSGLRAGELDEFPVIDVAIDGADEVDSELNCIKGGGAAQLREKLVAAAAKKFVLIADYRKNSDTLGMQWTSGVPVEVVPSAWASVKAALESLAPSGLFGGRAPAHSVLAKYLLAKSAGERRVFELPAPTATLRLAVRKAGPVVTDNGNFVLDVHFGRILDVDALEILVKMVPGVVEVGLFCRMAQEAWFGNADGSTTTKVPESETKKVE